MKSGEPKMKSILDPSFHYVNSYSTDVKKTFARVRRELSEQSALPRQAVPMASLHGITHKRTTAA